MQYRDFSECLFETALALEIADSQYHFSTLCGRKPSWFSATKATSRPISTQALVTLAMNIELQIDEGQHRNRRKQLRQFQRIVWQTLIARLSNKAKLSVYSGQNRAPEIRHGLS
jgi:hypothetical protein